MNSMPWENVICEAKIEETTQSGAKVTIKCDGVMLPIESWDRCHRVVSPPSIPQNELYWKCHKCGREVK